MRIVVALGGNALLQRGQVPDAAATDMSYGFTLPPTATPSPTPPPLDLSVEED